LGIFQTLVELVHHRGMVRQCQVDAKQPRTIPIGTTACTFSGSKASSSARWALMARGQAVATARKPIGEWDT